MQTHRIPKTVEPTTSRSAYEYELSRINYTEGSDVWAERENRKYIYVLFSASKQSLPFYVGQTSNLVKRFSKHGEISWHYGKYSRKTIVHVIASVPASMATTAEKQTIKILTNKGFILNNDSLNSAKIEPFKDLSSKDIAKLVAKVKDIPTAPLFKSMRKYWLQQESQIAADNTDFSELTKTKILRKVKQRSYANNQSRSLSLLLANKYNQATGAATHVFPITSLKTEAELVNMVNIQVKGLLGDWYLKNSTIVLGLPLDFYPSDGLLNAKNNAPSYGTRPATKKETLDYIASLPKADTILPPATFPLSAEEMEYRKVRDFLATVSRLEMMKAVQLLFSDIPDEKVRILAMSVAKKWDKAQPFSTYKVAKNTNTSSIRHLWFYGKRSEFSAFKQFYPTKKLVEVLIAQKGIKEL